MAKFDLTKTREVQDLLAVDREQRGPEWISRFYRAIVDASMATTPDQVLQGPDGFTYFVLKLPPAEQAFEPFCISHILDVCLDRGAGIVVQPEPHPPQWVFPYGLLWSYKEFSAFVVDQPEGKQGSEEGVQPAAGGTVLAGQPSAAFFPAYARTVVRRFLIDSIGVAVPEVLLLHDPGAVPERSLAFNIFPDDFAEPEEFGNVMYRLTWFLPRHYGLISISRDSEFVKMFQPL
jgi:hypothetical protein